VLLRPPSQFTRAGRQWRRDQAPQERFREQSRVVWSNRAHPRSGLALSDLQGLILLN